MMLMGVVRYVARVFITAKLKHKSTAKEAKKSACTKDT